jgi:hypothetical protein
VFYTLSLLGFRSGGASSLSLGLGLDLGLALGLGLVLRCFRDRVCLRVPLLLGEV